jgi:dihydrofolate reductase
VAPVISADREAQLSVRRRVPTKGHGFGQPTTAALPGRIIGASQLSIVGPAGRVEPLMGRVVVSENVTLDGIVQDPAGDEGFSRGGWVGLIKDRPQVNELALEDASGAEALLLGRRSYEWFAARWPSRSGELAERLNSLPKYVVSSGLDDQGWTNTTVVRGDVIGAVTKLRQELNGELLVLASFRLLRALFENDLVDELRLKVYPVVLGAGERLFGEATNGKAMRLVDARALDGAVAYLTYQIVRG